MRKDALAIASGALMMIKINVKLNKSHVTIKLKCKK